MVKKVFIHAGFHKTGTTGIQTIFKESRSVFREEGITYPYARGEGHHRPAWALHESVWGWKDKGGKKTPISEWNHLVTQVKKARDAALISSEFFSELTIEEIRTMKGAFGKAEQRVIFTWRPLQKLLSSSYQQYLKYGIKADYRQWLLGVFKESEYKNYTPTFWERHRHGEVLSKWVEVFGADNVKVIVADEKNPNFLYDSFADVLGIERTLIRADKNNRKNRSLTWEETALLLEVNNRFPKERAWADYEMFVREGAFSRLANNDYPGDTVTKLLTPAWAVDAALAENQKAITQIRGLGIQVIGDLEVASGEPIPVGENQPVTSISLVVAAEAILGSSSRSVKRMAGSVLIKELLRRVKYKGLRIKRKII
jgi:hypothetical protein